MIVDHKHPRRSARHAVQLAGQATFSADLATLDPGKAFAVGIKNVSKGGLAVTLSLEQVMKHDLDYRKHIRVRFLTNEGENKVVQARVVWFAPQDGGMAVGLELVDDDGRHDDFREWVEDLE